MLCALVGGLGALSFSAAGPLDPPPGPVTPTNRTLDEIYNAIQAVNAGKGTPITALPITINQPGKYYLTQNFTVGDVDAITIGGDNITIDLNGFTITGNYAGGAAGTRRGIVVTSPGGGAVRTNISIRNGAIRGFSAAGIEAVFAAAGEYSNLSVIGCGKSGLIAGDNSSIRDVQARSNREAGISAGLANTVERCTAQANGVRPNTALGCGFAISAGSTVRGCSALSNQGSGFILGSQCVIAQCNASNNDVSGILAAGDNLIEGNSCTNNGQNVANGGGITTTGQGNRVVSNNCVGNDRNFDIAAGVAAGGTFLGGNSASRPTGGGVNYNIGANNAYGQILNFPGSGFSGAGAFVNIVY